MPSQHKSVFPAPPLTFAAGWRRKRGRGPCSRGKRPPRQAGQPNAARCSGFQPQHLAAVGVGSGFEHQLRHNGKAAATGHHSDHGLVIHDIAAAVHPQVVGFEVALDIGIHVRQLADERLAAQFLGADAAGPGRAVGRGCDADQLVII